MIHTVKGFGVVDKAEAGVFLLHSAGAAGGGEEIPHVQGQEFSVLPWTSCVEIPH